MIWLGQLLRNHVLFMERDTNVIWEFFMALVWARDPELLREAASVMGLVGMCLCQARTGMAGALESPQYLRSDAGAGWFFPDSR